MPTSARNESLLGDTPARDYSRKLQLFNAFARREIRETIACLDLKPGMDMLDAGCGVGDALEWFSHVVGASGSVTGIDLSAAHVVVARSRALPQARIFQGSILNPPFAPRSFDFIWCANTINHLRDPLEGVNRLVGLLRSNGQLALVQSSFLPEMFFAWDARLEKATNDAVRRYYQERYQIGECDLASTRALIGLLRRADLKKVAARTAVIERISPLDEESELYLREAIFRDTWGERLRPYLAPKDYAELQRLCDPTSPNFALRRPDFHIIQTLTTVTAHV